VSRPKKSAATLNEVMGAKIPEGLKDLPGLLGEKMPELPNSTVGKIRLLRALKNRFGDGFRTFPGIKGILKEFDKKVRIEQIVSKNRRR